MSRSCKTVLLVLLSVGLMQAMPLKDVYNMGAQIWTDRIIPYQLDDDLNSTERVMINQAMIEIMEGSGHCITFVERSNQHDFIYITGKLDGCYGDVGRKGGNQTVSVCRTQKKGLVLHELMHILGFWHEHTRQDRDDFIMIHNESIQPGHHKDFQIQKGHLLNISYDYYSILHYKTNTFSKNRLNSRQNTIEIKNHTIQEDEVGKQEKLSDKDQQRIKALYECPNNKCSYPKKLNDGSVQVTSTSVGYRTLYSCTRDYVLVGAVERTCLFDGTWSGSLSLCFRKSANWFYCDFETPSLCGWSQNTTDEADWARGSSHTKSDNTGPLVDHTKQNSEGHYMYFEGTDVIPNSSARLVSPLIPPKPGSQACVFFWYNMYGKGMGTIKVWLQHDDGRTDILWSLSGNQNFGWKMQITHPIIVSANYRVVFEGIRGSLDTTDMAIDDVMVGPCDELESYKNAVIREHKEDGPIIIHACGFDHGLCGWYNHTTGGLVWRDHSGSTQSLHTGPTCDLHTCTHGSYVYLEASQSHVPGSATWIYSPQLQGNGYACITFNYHLYGSDIGNMTLYLQTNHSIQPIWSSTGNHGDVWVETHVQVNVINTFQITMVGDLKGGFSGDIAFDNFMVVSRRCPKGNFVYIEASSPRIEGDTARLLTPFLEVNDVGYCVSFFYYMYGDDVSSLRLIGSREDGSKEILWKKQGNIGPKWMKAEVTVLKREYKLHVNIIFEADVGASYKSDIALDDITIKEEVCI